MKKDIAKNERYNEEYIKAIKDYLSLLPSKCEFNEIREENEKEYIIFVDNKGQECKEDLNYFNEYRLKQFFKSMRYLTEFQKIKEKYKREGKNEQLQNMIKSLEETCKNISNYINSLPLSKEVKEDSLIAISDVEGKLSDTLMKLKTGGVIESFNFDLDTHKPIIKLNPKFKGTLTFSGDLTKEGGRHNDEVIDIFEQLNDQIKNANKNRSKEERIKFIAIPGNHEFPCKWAIDNNIPTKTKMNALRVIAKIQKSYLEQIRDNNDYKDIIDDDYEPGKTKEEAEQEVKKKIEELEEEISKYDTNDEKKVNKYENSVKQFLEEYEKYQRRKRSSKDFNLPDVLKNNEYIWKNSKIMSKIVFKHKGKKMRTLHSFLFFTPKSVRDGLENKVYYEDGCKKEKWEIPQDRMNQDNQKNIIKFNPDLDMDWPRCFPPYDIFIKNEIPTLVGHEGHYRSKKENNEAVFCVDKDQCLFVMNDGIIKGYDVIKGKVEEEKELKIRDEIVEEEEEIENNIREYFSDLGKFTIQKSLVSSNQYILKIGKEVQIVITRTEAKENNKKYVNFYVNNCSCSKQLPINLESNYDLCYCQEKKCVLKQKGYHEQNDENTVIYEGYRKYVGLSKDNKRNGYGKEFYSNGHIYEGNYKDDLQNGIGVETNNEDGYLFADKKGGNFLGFSISINKDGDSIFISKNNDNGVMYETVKIKRNVDGKLSFQYSNFSKEKDINTTKSITKFFFGREGENSLFKYGEINNDIERNIQIGCTLDETNWKNFKELICRKIRKNAEERIQKEEEEKKKQIEKQKKEAEENKPKRKKKLNIFNQYKEQENHNQFLGEISISKKQNINNNNQKTFVENIHLEDKKQGANTNYSNNKKQEEQSKYKVDYTAIQQSKAEIIDYIETGKDIQNLNIQGILAYLEDEKTYKNMGNSITRNIGFNRLKKKRYYTLCRYIYSNYLYNLELSSKENAKRCESIFDERQQVDKTYRDTIQTNYERQITNVNNNPATISLTDIKNILNQVEVCC